MDYPGAIRNHRDCCLLVISLQKTDITQPALEALEKSQVRRVLIVGRRGPIQIACTIKVLNAEYQYKQTNHLQNSFYNALGLFFFFVNN